MTFTDRNLECREIVTKAVCGKGRKFSQVTHDVTPPHRPTSILGAWIINHKYEAVRSTDSVEVVGSYDINVWYSYNNNSRTEVAKETVSYVEIVPLSYHDPKHRANTEEVTAEATQEPNCIEASISSQGFDIIVRVEREFKVEMIAETKVCVVVNPHGCGSDDDKGLDLGFDHIDDEFEDLDPQLLDELDDDI